MSLEKPNEQSKVLKLSPPHSTAFLKSLIRSHRSELSHRPPLTTKQAKDAIGLSELDLIQCGENWAHVLELSRDPVIQSANRYVVAVAAMGPYVSKLLETTKQYAFQFLRFHVVTAAY